MVFFSNNNTENNFNNYLQIHSKNQQKINQKDKL